jgi:general secretion pathway protein E
MIDLPARFPYAFAKSQGVMLLAVKGGQAHLLVREEASLEALAEAKRMVAIPTTIAMAASTEYDRRLAEIYSAATETAASVADDIGGDLDLSQLLQDLPKIEDLLDEQNDAPIIRMINVILTQAVKAKASDIHIEPFEQTSVVRFRQDGTLRNVIAPRRALHAAMVSRIKIMANLDIAERRVPQDGRITIRIAGRPIDIRVSSVPTNHGERVVLRLLDKDPEQLNLGALGMDLSVRDRVDRLVHQPHGIVLVTGPTGSGKTTTLYAAIGRLDSQALNIMTVEDPVEYELAGIGQIQVNPRTDLTFSKALRAILRQDPDVIMIGEIRDIETAQIAVQASLTGHLVLATLHTNDSVSAVTRLVDMGIEPFLLASSLSGVLAQRLVRRLCPVCREAYPAGPRERELFPEWEMPKVLYRPLGCAECNQTGYSGRAGIFEVFELDPSIRALIHDGAAEQVIRDKAVTGQLHTLRADAQRWVASGETSLEEVLRVIRG